MPVGLLLVGRTRLTDNDDSEKKRRSEHLAGSGQATDDRTQSITTRLVGYFDVADVDNTRPRRMHGDGRHRRSDDYRRFPTSS